MWLSMVTQEKTLWLSKATKVKFFVSQQVQMQGTIMPAFYHNI